MDINYKQLGVRIKKERINNSITQERLAELVNVSNVYISHIENGSAKPSLDVLVKICNALNITPDFALTGSINNSERYIRNDIAKMLQKCSPKTMHLISKVIETIIKEENT